PTALHDGEKNLQYTADVYNDSTRCASLLFAGASGSYLIWKRLECMASAMDDEAAAKMTVSRPPAPA
ncbi:hypothetical protein, partial [Extensimonas perlucida]|uniref:hypothetical protein n=1 Tax=Extensimonas perlucida TaxID=2590786 RepID=UPI001C92C0EE